MGYQRPPALVCQRPRTQDKARSEKSIGLSAAINPVTFSPTKFSPRLRDAKTLNSFHGNLPDRKKPLGCRAGDETMAAIGYSRVSTVCRSVGYYGTSAATLSGFTAQSTCLYYRRETSAFSQAALSSTSRLRVMHDPITRRRCGELVDIALNAITCAIGLH
jgi:hypothetical protein